MANSPIGGLMEGSLEKIKEMVDANTIIGDPIVTRDGVTIIPVSKVTFGFTSGGSEFASKHEKEGSDHPFGGVAGAGVNIIPIAFLVIREDNVRVLNVQPPELGSVEKILDAAPDAIDRIADFFRNRKKKKEESEEEKEENNEKE